MPSFPRTSARGAHLLRDRSHVISAMSWHSGRRARRFGEPRPSSSLKVATAPRRIGGGAGLTREPSIYIVGHGAAGEFNRRIHATDEEALVRPILQERRLRSLLALDNHDPLAVLFVEVRMDIREEERADAVTDEVDQMQPHFIVVRKVVRGQADDLAVVGNTDDQGATLVGEDPAIVLRAARCIVSSMRPVWRFVRSVALNSTASPSPDAIRSSTDTFTIAEGFTSPQSSR